MATLFTRRTIRWRPEKLSLYILSVRCQDASRLRAKMVVSKHQQSSVSTILQHWNNVCARSGLTFYMGLEIDNQILHLLSVLVSFLFSQQTL